MAVYRAPAFREAPVYSGPSWNEAEVNALTQRRAAPGLRAMRQQVNRISGGNFDNPNVKRMTLRDALAGYGAGVSGVIGTASQAAANEYSNKFSNLSQNARFAYEGNLRGAQDYNTWAANASAMDYASQLNDEARAEARHNYELSLREARKQRLREETAQNRKQYLTATAKNEALIEAKKERWLNPPRTKTEEEERAWELSQRTLDDQWKRWKTQQEYIAKKALEEEYRKKNQAEMEKGWTDSTSAVERMRQQVELEELRKRLYG